MANENHISPELPSFAPDPRAVAAIARFEATKQKSAPATKPAALPRVKSRRWPIWIAGAAALTLLGGVAHWITGATPRDLYDKFLSGKLSAAQKAHQINSFWQQLPPPRAHDETEADLLRPAGAPDPQFKEYSATDKKMPVRQLGALIAAAKSGDVVTLQPGRYTDCAVIAQDRLTLRAVKPGSVILDGGTCEEKAGLVFRGGLLVIEGLMFRNMRVSDGNGAGIRQERGALIVRNAVFYNNQSGILVNSGPNMSLQVSNSQFARNGSCRSAGGCAHSIYAGEIDKVEVLNSRFRLASGGHFLKSRARQTHVTGSQFDDAGGIASYLIDLPYGSAGVISDNRFFKSKTARNRLCIIRVGSEGAKQSSAQLSIRGNAARSELPLTIFLYNDTTDPIQLGKNELGPGMLASHGKTGNP